MWSLGLIVLFTQIWRLSHIIVCHLPEYFSSICKCCTLIAEMFAKDLIVFQVQGHIICGKLQSRDRGAHAIGQGFTGLASLNLHDAENHLL